MTTAHLLAYIAVMAGVTYLIRMLPMVVFRKKIESRFLKSFLFYVPYAVLTAMTVPAVFTSTGSFVTALAGFFVAALFAYRGASLLPVALVACGTAFAADLLLRFLA
ncbi:MAG: AzlD domain-containing protein [Ruthenibacterium sp.]